MYQVAGFKEKSDSTRGGVGTIERSVKAAVTGTSASVCRALGRLVVRGSSNATTALGSKQHVHAAQYAKLWAAVEAMAKADVSSPIYIDDGTWFDASNFLALLRSFEVDPPRVFSHGGDAATFTWEIQGARRRYATPCGGEVAFHENGIVPSMEVNSIYQLANKHSLISLMRVLGGNV